MQRQAINEFLEAATKMCNARNASHKLYSVVLVRDGDGGKKYQRIVRKHRWHNCPDALVNGSVYVFIDLENGNILKPASFKTADRKNPRSNVNDNDYGLSGVTEYGAVYLK